MSNISKKKLYFRLKNQEYNPKIKEGELIGVAIQEWRDFVWCTCGYLFVPNDQEAIKNLEKERNQDYFIYLESKMRLEEFKEDLTSEKGEKLGVIGRKKVYVEDSDWGKNVKVIYYGMLKYFTPTKVLRNENNLLHVEVEPREFYQDRMGVLDYLIFKGESINQYRNLIAENLGKEFKMPSYLLNCWDEETNVVNSKNWYSREGEKIILAEEKTNKKPEKTTSEIRESLEEYYSKNDIKSMKLNDEDQELLDIVFNSGKRQPDNINYLKSNGKKSLDFSELSGEKTEENNQNNFDWTPYDYVGGGILISATILFFIIKKKSKKNNYVK